MLRVACLLALLSLAILVVVAAHLDGATTTRIARDRSARRQATRSIRPCLR